MRNQNLPSPGRRRLATNWAAPGGFSVPIRAARRFDRCRSATPGCARWRAARHFSLSFALPFAMVLLLAGCAGPAVNRQRLVSKPNMLFSDSPVFTYNAARLLPQLEPGSAGSGGAQNSGCTSCR